MAAINATYPPEHCGVADYSEKHHRALQAIDRPVTVFTNQRPRPAGAVPLQGRFQKWGPYDLIRLFAAVRRYSNVHIQYHGGDFFMRNWILFLPPLLKLFERSVRITVTCHNLDFSGSARRLHLDHFFFRHSDTIILTSTRDHDRFCRLPGSSDLINRCRVIPTGPGFEMPYYRPRRPSRRVFTFAYFGYLNPAKGIEVLFKAAAICRRKSREKFIVQMFAGFHDSREGEEKSPYETELRKLTRVLQIHSIIQWRGFQEQTEMPIRLKTIDAIILPFQGGFYTRRSSLMTMATAGTLMVTSEGPHFPEEIKNGRHLLTFESDNPEALAAVMQKLKSGGISLKTAAAMTRRMRDVVTKGPFSWPVIAAQVDQIYV